MKKQPRARVNETKKVSAVEFKKRYAELAIRVKMIKAKLKDALKDAKAIEKDACALRHFGNENLYTEDDHGIHPAFRGLSLKMDTLEMWEGMQFSVSNAVESC